MSEEEKIALFDAYLNNELSEADRVDFESLLEKNVDFKAEFEEYKSVSHEIFEGAEYGQIISNLDQIHGDIYGKKGSKPLILRPRFYIPVSIAAGLALLFTIVNPLGGSNEDMMADNNADYIELDNDEATEEYAEGEDDVSYMSPEEPMDSLADPVLEETLPIVNKTPKGSCFLISNDGFFITSKHLVKKRRYVKIQQKDREVVFNAEVIYRDSLLDFAILQCAPKQTDNFRAVPFKFYKKKPSLGEDVFTLGYPKPDIVYTTGVVSSETGYKSDSVSYEVSMPSNPGNSGAPLFTKKGDLVGMVIANNSKKQSVTYILKPYYIQERLNNLKDSLNIDMRDNYTKRFSKVPDMIDKYRSFIFEIH